MDGESAVVELFVHFVEAFNRGESPSADVYVGRAGEAGERLRAMIRAFVSARSELDESVARVRAGVKETVAEWGSAFEDEELPFHALLRELEEAVRREHKCRREEITSRIAEQTGLPEAYRRKFRTHYHRLKTGRVDPHGLAPGLVEGIATVLKMPVGRLLAAAMTYRGEDRQPSVQFTRADRASASDASQIADEEQGTDWDMVDRMFFGNAPDV